MAAAMTHAKRQHICSGCSKVMHGNGYKNHLRHCKAYAAYKENRGKGE